jgi:3',5'-cyclic AMP phosphodiesterase CpdA
MTESLRLAFTADLHWGVRRSGDEATRLLVDFLRAAPPDVLVIAGDVGTGRSFEECLALFDDLPARKLVVPGNHDLWIERDDPRGDSLWLYREHLPASCAAHGIHLLDTGPIVFPGAGLALAGTINWYDYSWSIAELRRRFADWKERLETKRFLRGRHNDAVFIRWPLDDVRFTAEVVAAFEKHYRQTRREVEQVIVVTHHPPLYGLNFPRPRRADAAPLASLDSLLWDAFAGNTALEAFLLAEAAHVPFAFCGHTHRERESVQGGIRGYNIGGDYHFKRLLTLDWPTGRVEAHTFGNPSEPGP